MQNATTIVSPASLAASIRAHKGDITAVSAETGVSRTTIYTYAKKSTEVKGAIDQTRKKSPRAVRDFLIRSSEEAAPLRVSAEDVEVRQKEKPAESFMTAARAILVDRIHVGTELSKREVLHQLDADLRAKSLFERYLPSPPEKEEKEQITVNLSLDESTWLQRQSKGFAAKLFSSLKEYPVVSLSLPGTQCVTSYLLPVRVIQSLKAAAAQQGVTPNAIFRTVVREQMAASSVAA